MCEFISWVEFNGKTLFLTDDDIKIWERSKDRPKIPDKSEIAGHGAIRVYYGLMDGDGVDKECKCFSTPNSFPKEIVKAIKTGKITYAIPDGLSLLLTDPALAKYNKITDPAWAEYNKIKDTAWAEYNKIRDPALAEYNKITDPALAEFKKIKDTAWAEFNKKTISVFWKLFKIKKNRRPQWK